MMMRAEVQSLVLLAKPCSGGVHGIEERERACQCDAKVRAFHLLCSWPCFAGVPGCQGPGQLSLQCTPLSVSGPVLLVFLGAKDPVSSACSAHPSLSLTLFCACAYDLLACSGLRFGCCQSPTAPMAAGALGRVQGEGVCVYEGREIR